MSLGEINYFGVVSEIRRAAVPDGGRDRGPPDQLVELAGQIVGEIEGGELIFGFRGESGFPEKKA